MAVKRWNGSAWETYAGAETSYGFEATDARVGRKTWVGANTPTNPSDGDIWIDQDTTTNSVAASAFDAKGDLLVGTGPDTFTRQAIGLDGQVLVADSTQADGLKWDYANRREGLTLVVPTSVSVGSGSATISANGAINFSGASTITINGCFTQTYDNYRITYTGINSVNLEQIRFKAAKAGTAISTGNYYVAGYTSRSSAASLIAFNQSGAAYQLIVNEAGSGEGNTFVMDIFTPYITLKQVGVNVQSTSVTGTMTISQGLINTNDNYDGFHLYPGSGTIGGTIRIYGYNNGA